MTVDSTMLTAPYGDLAEFEEFGRNHRYLDSIWAALVRDYEHEFVAAHERRIANLSQPMPRWGLTQHNEGALN